MRRRWLLVSDTSAVLSRHWTFGAASRELRRRENGYYGYYSTTLGIKKVDRHNG